MKAAISMLGIVAATLSLSAAAQSSNPAFYVGATVGQSNFKDACSGTPAGVTCDDKDTAWRLLGGYQFNRNLSAELGYHNFGEAKASAFGTSASVKANAWELVGVGLLPVGAQFGVYGKLGGYHGEAKADSSVGSAKDSNNSWTYGAGLQYDIMPALGLRGEWQRYHDLGGNNAGHGDIDVLSLGAVWRFR